MSKEIYYRLSWSSVEGRWSFLLGVAAPDSSGWSLFEDGTLFQPRGPSSYAMSTPEGAVSSVEARARASVEEAERRLEGARRKLEGSQKLLAMLEGQKAVLQREGAALAECRTECCRRLVGELINDDVDVVRLWFKSKNPLLDDLSPDDLIASHRTEELLRFIKGQK